MVALLIGTVLLSGCAKTVYRTQLEIYCPPITVFDENFNNKLADELESLPSDATAIPEALSNYVYLRDRVRQCQIERDNL